MVGQFFTAPRFNNGLIAYDARATNSYISDIVFYIDDNGYLAESFHVDQNFSLTYYFGSGGC
jgi:hypothetical protein